MADETIAILFTLLVLPFAVYKLLFGVSAKPPRQPAPAPPRTEPAPPQAAHGTSLEKA